jgi:L-rhamnose mutarotase
MPVRELNFFWEAHLKRYGMVIGVKPEHEEAYREAHRAVPSEVLRMIHDCNMRNYSIFLRNSVLYSYFEYVGTDFDADMAKMAADPATQEWWKRVGPMQEPILDRAPGEWWAAMEEVFHVD